MGVNMEGVRCKNTAWLDGWSKQVVNIIRRATGMLLLPCGNSLLESLFKFSYPVHLSEHFKNWIQINYVTL